MKRFMAVFLVLVSLASVATAAAAGVAEAPGAEDVVRALGIMVGDENGDMDLDGSVTRAQFCKMMTVASPYKDSAATASGYSMFSDLRPSHWVYGYVTVAVSNGWFVGYVDGTFKPDATIKLEEAATALLRLLGYGKADVPGTYPAAQLGRAEGLGLLHDISARPGETLTRRDAMTMFYNLLTATTKDGAAYAGTIGCKLDGAGKLDYMEIVASGMEGPFVFAPGDKPLADALPFGNENATVYIDGRETVLSGAAAHDVYYYNSNLRTVWLVRDSVTGVLSGVAPTVASPESITVSGVNYAVGSSDVKYKVSSSGGLRVGDTVTVLLGFDGVAAGIMPASEFAGRFYGVVIEKYASVYTGADGKSGADYTVKVACTDGSEREYAAASSSIEVGYIVECGYTGSRLEAATITSGGVGGTVSRDAASLGDIPFSDDIEILDADKAGGYAVVEPARLGGVTLTRDNVRFYLLDSTGEISRLILNNVTGDLYQYVLLTGVSENMQTTNLMSVSGVYDYLRNGEPGRVTGNAIYFAKHGGAVIQYDAHGAVSKVRNLAELAPESLSKSSLVANGRTYELADGVQVYIRSGSDYFAVEPDDVSDLDKYTLRAWYDDLGAPAGGKIRVILAQRKSLT
ncbi:MAG: S-layer homology domain-containing protein [Oscillospiraceae bacterium]|nr:S-layer homology domain-containing protein [Oscillospiraceae bacterium]